MCYPCLVFLLPTSPEVSLEWVLQVCIGKRQQSRREQLHELGTWTCMKRLDALATYVLEMSHWGAHGWFQSWVTGGCLCLPLIPVQDLLGTEQQGLCWSPEL